MFGLSNMSERLYISQENRSKHFCGQFYHLLIWHYVKVEPIYSLLQLAELYSTDMSFGSPFYASHGAHLYIALTSI